MEYRSGLGWDVHRTGPGTSILLGGVEIPADFGLVGHSDADALFHAITDAVLGAAALWDIGMHFPDTDPEWKGASSDLFLRRAVKLAAGEGFELVNVDATVILQRPKLKDYRSAIRHNVAAAAGLPAERVNVKFKTAEEVGPVGEGRSVEAQATVMLRRED
jgi:2-C-methyl-D-erythritol 2,4-cyclodiphosphate synthase